MGGTDSASGARHDGDFPLQWLLHAGHGSPTMRRCTRHAPMTKVDADRVTAASLPACGLARSERGRDRFESADVRRVLVDDRSLIDLKVRHRAQDLLEDNPGFQPRKRGPQASV